MLQPRVLQSLLGSRPDFGVHREEGRNEIKAAIIGFRHSMLEPSALGPQQLIPSLPQKAYFIKLMPSCFEDLTSDAGFSCHEANVSMCRKVWQQKEIILKVALYTDKDSDAGVSRSFHGTTY